MPKPTPNARGGTRPRIVIFPTLQNLVWRSAGHAPWGNAGPCYLRDERETVGYREAFSLRARLSDLFHVLLRDL